jgi:hypothetical protein
MDALLSPWDAFMLNSLEDSSLPGLPALSKRPFALPSLLLECFSPVSFYNYILFSHTFLLI